MEPFIKLSRDDRVDLLIREDPLAFVLLTVIARRARRTDEPIVGLHSGEAFLGDFSNQHLTRQQYRTRLKKLKKWNLITTRSTTRGTIARLTDTSVYDINALESNQQSNQQCNQRATNEQPTPHTKPNQRATTNKNDKKKNKNERMKEDNAEATPTAPQIQKDITLEELHRPTEKSSDLQEAMGRWVVQFPAYALGGLTQTWRRKCQDLLDEHGKENVFKGFELIGEKNKPSMEYLKQVLLSKKQTGYQWVQFDQDEAGNYLVPTSDWTKATFEPTGEFITFPKFLTEEFKKQNILQSKERRAVLVEIPEGLSRYRRI